MELGYGTLRIRYRETATNLSNVVYIEYDIIKTLLRNAITIILTTQKSGVSPSLSLGTLSYKSRYPNRLSSSNTVGLSSFFVGCLNSQMLERMRACSLASSCHFLWLYVGLAACIRFRICLFSFSMRCNSRF